MKISFQTACLVLLVTFVHLVVVTMLSTGAKPEPATEAGFDAGAFPGERDDDPEIAEVPDVETDPTESDVPRNPLHAERAEEGFPEEAHPVPPGEVAAVSPEENLFQDPDTVSGIDRVTAPEPDEAPARPARTEAGGDSLAGARVIREIRPIPGS